MPWLLLIARIWFGQVVLVHQIMAMAAAPAAGSSAGGLHVPSGLDAALHGVIPLLLTVGFLTRPIALVLLAGPTLLNYSALGAGPEGARLALLAWLVVIGPGTLSVDALLGRGLSWVPFGAARLLSRAYAWIGRYLGPFLLLVIRASIAVPLIAAALQAPSWLHNAMPGNSVAPFVHPVWLATALACAIALGCMTRFAVLICAAMVSLTGIAMSMDDRLAILLLLLALAATGAGVFLHRPASRSMG